MIHFFCGVAGVGSIRNRDRQARRTRSLGRSRLAAKGQRHNHFHNGTSIWSGMTSRPLVIRPQVDGGPNSLVGFASYLAASICLANSVRKSCSFWAMNFL
jgi:hypothetical protein